MAAFGARADAIQGAWTSARERWPDVRVELEPFSEYVGRRLAGADGVEEAVDSLNCEELYLACGCSRGLSPALEAFERDYFVNVDAALSRIRGLGDRADDVKQTLRQELFSPPQGQRAKIESYSGRGTLLGWLRVTVVRAAHKVVKQDAVRSPISEHLIADAQHGPKDEELEYFKRLYRREFKEAFEAAVDGLGRRDRNLLRHHVVDQLSIDQISAIYHVHRSTAARQIDRARQILREQTRERLLAQLNVAPEELESIVRMVDTQLDLSVYRVLAGPTHK